MQSRNFKGLLLNVIKISLHEFISLQDSIYNM